MSLLVVGSVAYDSVESPKGKVDMALGGSAVFFSAAASLFTQVNAVGVVGDDYKMSDLDFLKDRSVGLDGVKQVPGKTFSWGGVYGNDWNDRETLFTELGVFADFKPEIPESYRKSDYVFLANIAPDLQNDVLAQVDCPKLVVLDTMNFWIEGQLDSLLKAIEQTDLLIINDQEIKQLTGINDIFQASDKVLNMGPKYLVVKKGEHGAVLISKTDKFFAAIYPVDEVIDPTGAGDSFAGGFMGYLAREDNLEWETMKKAVIYGTAAASFTVEDFSVNRLKAATMSEIDNRVDTIRKMTNF